MTIMDYCTSHSSAIVVVVVVLLILLLVVGGKNSIFSEMTEPILFKFGPQMQINKVGGIFS